MVRDVGVPRRQEAGTAVSDLAALLLPVEREGPVCAAWEPDSGELCEHDSCWDIMSLGGSAAGRAIARASHQEEGAQMGGNGVTDTRRIISRLRSIRRVAVALIALNVLVLARFLAEGSALLLVPAALIAACAVLVMMETRTLLIARATERAQSRGSVARPYLTGDLRLVRGRGRQRG